VEHSGHPRLDRALIVDDHPLFCEALAMTLGSALGVREVATAASLAEGIARLEGGAPPDVVLLDLKLPDVDGLDGLVRLKRSAGETPVVVVSSLTDDRLIASALRAGAAGFVPKHSRREVFVEALGRVRAGGVYTPDGYYAPEAGTELDADTVVTRMQSLTPQQARILELVCEGMLNKQIAWELEIAETTVKAHLTAILRKLHVHSRTQAVLLAQNARFGAILRPQG
jgi:DNA-binding NarL/FixJ family response regulator